MPRESAPLQAFNRGIISKLGLARTDLKRTALSAEIQTNWMPRVLGSMMLRPGFGLKASTLNNKKAFHIPFIYAVTDQAKLEFTDQNMRVKVDDVALSRPAVASIVTNGNFAGDLTGWTNADQPGAVSQWVSGNMMSLQGTRYNAAVEQQQIMVASPDVGVEHGIRIVVTRGPVIFKAGSTAGDDDYIGETELGTGVHSLSLHPGGAFWIELSSYTEYSVLVGSIAIEAAGDMIIPAPWFEADLSLLRYDESADVIYVACKGTYQQQKIERRTNGDNNRSWSIVNYEPEDGPFQNDNTTTTRLMPSALSGDITITSDRSYFRAGNVGSLIRVTSIGQQVQLSVGGDGQFTDPIRVSDVGANRLFNINISGTFSATITLQRSVGDASSWEDVAGSTYTGPTSTTLNDGFDNQIIYYRLGIETGNYTSGTAVLNLSYATGGLTGIARVTAFNSVTNVNAVVLTPFGGTALSEIWAEGEWSPRRGYPAECVLAEGRLWWFGPTGYQGSVAGAYESFDDTVVGDAAPINRTLGSGPVDSVNFALSLKRLVIGTDTAEWSIRSDALDDPLTDTNINAKTPSTEGSAPVAALAIDYKGIFVHRTGTKVFMLDNSTDYIYGDYHADDLSQLTPELCLPGIIRIAVQRQPDTRIHCVMRDGTAAVLVFDSVEQVKCWVLMETDGMIEDVIISPRVNGNPEDDVQYTIARTIGGAVVRSNEQWAQEIECNGGTYTYPADSDVNPIAKTIFADLPFLDGTLLTARAGDGTKIGNFTVADGAVTLGAAVSFVTLTPTIMKLADMHILYSGAATSTITGLNALDGQQVVCWADGKDMGGLARNTFTVTGGAITLPEAVENAVIGLYYEAKFKSVKLAFASDEGSALTKKKKVDHVGVVASSMHYQGLRFGTDFDVDGNGNYLHLDDMPQGDRETTTPADTVWPDYDDQPISFPGTWNTDSRLCLLAQAPRPCTLLAAIVEMNTNG